MQDKMFSFFLPRWLLFRIWFFVFTQLQWKRFPASTGREVVKKAWELCPWEQVGAMHLITLMRESCEVREQEFDWRKVPFFSLVRKKRLLTACSSGPKGRGDMERCAWGEDSWLRVRGPAPTCPTDLALQSGPLRPLLAGTRCVLKLQIKA